MYRFSALAIAGLLLGACQMSPQPPVTLAKTVDIPRFMGDWYVIATIPTPFEKDAFNALERYRLADGYIDTTFSYNKGAFDGPEKAMRAKGFVREEGNGAVWGMQFIWPIRADYRVMHVAEDYSATVIGRNQRDYLWIMARTPTLPEAQLESLLAFCRQEGYDLSKLRMVPQKEPVLASASNGSADTRLTRLQ
jgi:apolipoprotein D and lipocalin family protein